MCAFTRDYLKQNLFCDSSFPVTHRVTIFTVTNTVQLSWSCQKFVEITGNKSDTPDVSTNTQDVSVVKLPINVMMYRRSTYKLARIPERWHTVTGCVERTLLILAKKYLLLSGMFVKQYFRLYFCTSFPSMWIHDLSVWKWYIECIHQTAFQLNVLVKC